MVVSYTKNMMKKYKVVLISMAPNGKNTSRFGCGFGDLSEEYIGQPMTVCVIGFSNAVFGGYNVAVYDQNMKSIIFDFGVIQEYEKTVIFTTRDTIYTFSVKL